LWPKPFSFDGTGHQAGDFSFSPMSEEDNIEMFGSEPLSEASGGFNQGAAGGMGPIRGGRKPVRGNTRALKFILVKATKGSNGVTYPAGKQFVGWFIPKGYGHQHFKTALFATMLSTGRTLSFPATAGRIVEKYDIQGAPKDDLLTPTLVKQGQATVVHNALKPKIENNRIVIPGRTSGCSGDYSQTGLKAFGLRCTTG